MHKPVAQFVITFSLCIGLFGCSSLQWIQEPSSPSPSCLPDRLLVWEDFAEQSWRQFSRIDLSSPAVAQISVRIRTYYNPPRLVVEFDPIRSWVRPEFRTLDGRIPASLRKRVLVHEQVHFMISCLLTREANHAIRSGADPMEMSKLVEAITQKINAQYDQDTKHGENMEAQRQWQVDVQQQFEEATVQNRESWLHQAKRKD